MNANYLFNYCLLMFLKLHLHPCVTIFINQVACIVVHWKLREEINQELLLFFSSLFLYKQAGFRALTAHFGAQNPTKNDLSPHMNRWVTMMYELHILLINLYLRVQMFSVISRISIPFPFFFYEKGRISQGLPITTMPISIWLQG